MGTTEESGTIGFTLRWESASPNLNPPFSRNKKTTTQKYIIQCWWKSTKKYYRRPSSPTVTARWDRLNSAVSQLNTQVWQFALWSVVGFMAGKTVAVMSLKWRHHHRCSACLCQGTVYPASTGLASQWDACGETANVTASPLVSWDVGSINST